MPTNSLWTLKAQVGTLAADTDSEYESDVMSSSDEEQDDEFTVHCDDFTATAVVDLLPEVVSDLLADRTDNATKVCSFTFSSTRSRSLRFRFSGHRTLPFPAILRRGRCPWTSLYIIAVLIMDVAFQFDL